MKYEELKRFILKEMRMQEGHNYQPVMIKTLNQNEGRATKEQIKQALHAANPEHPVSFFSDSPVFEVLTINHPVATFNKNTRMYELLDYDTYTTAEKAWITMYCDDKIQNPSSIESQLLKNVNVSITHNSFWLASGSWKNWEYTINNPPMRWGTKEKERNLWDKLNIGDIVFCSASSKTERLFKKNGIFMVGQVTRKYELEKNDGYYPGSKSDSTDFFKYRFELEPLKIVKRDEELLPIVDGLVFRKSINRITNPSVIGKLSENLAKYWNIKIGSQDKIEKLIYEFDRNRNYFASDRTLKKDETFKYRDEFLAKFPIDKIPDMKLDDYVIGKPDETTGEPRRDTFSYYLEKSLKAFGRISGRWSRFHGIYWNKEKNGYVWNGEFNNQNEAFEAIKSQIFSMLKAAQVLKKDDDWNEFAEFMSTQGKTVMANIKNKILCVYFPNLFLTLHKKQLLDDVLDEFHIKFNRKESRYLKEKKILDVKTSHPIMKNWDNLDLSYFLWKAILSRDEDIDSEDVGDFDEDVVSENNYLLLRHSAKKENKWRDDIGKQYHFGRIPNYTKLIPRSKTIWYDRDGGDFYYWGYGDISKTEQESEDHIHAYFDKFTYFNEPSEESPTTDDVVPKKGDEKVQQQIMSLPGWNNQISMLPITKDIYDAIVNAKRLSEQAEQVKTFADTSLEIPTTEELKSGIAKIQEELLIDSETIQEIVVNLVSGRHILLAGPVGTGKTRLAMLIPRYFWPKNNGYFSEVFTATAEWSTQDVIGGIMPKMVNEDVKYEIQYGCVTQTILENWLDKTCQDRIKNQHENETFNGTWLVIDEFNRADIDKAFGPLFTSLETKYLKVPSDKEHESYFEIKLPKDYRIIGTLNTADKHYLFRLSDALKRRFAYIEVSPPSKDQKDKEIYYALNNAIKELPQDIKFKWLSLNNSKLIIDEENSDQNLVSKIKIAYDVLDFIRASKLLGTAILKSIYQTLLIGSKVTQNFDNSLDLSLNTNLIPQLENVSTTTLETILSFFSDDVVEFFKKIHDESPTRERYSNDFAMLLHYCNVKSPDKKITAFSNGELNDENIWESIRNKVEEVKISAKIPIFSKSIRELIKTSSMI